MYNFVRVSRNKKTGPIPTTMTAQSSCPTTCPLKRNGCYAESGPTLLAWRKHTKHDLDHLTRMIQSLPKKQLWRHNVAGDLEHNNGFINFDILIKIIKANRGRRGFTYTHHEINAANITAIRAANDRGFTINASANNYQQADYYRSLDLPTVCILPTNATEKSYNTEQGNKIVTCPAVLHDHINCANCGICADSDRDFIVGFPAHGKGKKKANLIACKNI